ncbi:MAG TPA: hypothetical protein VFN67_04935 [Polyangiales bacterium]|nr:hypothetical protein [Polyangiales bacterium]
MAVGCASDIPVSATYGEPREAGGDTPPLAADMSPPEPLEPGAWQALDFDARRLFMRDVVMPAMRPLFVEVDEERFGSFSCISCHGQGAGDGSFAMPSSDLPALGGPPPDMPDAEQQRVIDFMRNTVKPKMAELLGEAELRCSTCHPSAS